jgi:hypothetical protein
MKYVKDLPIIEVVSSLHCFKYHFNGIFLVQRAYELLVLIPSLLRHPCGIASDAILELEGHNLPLYPCMHQRAQVKGINRRYGQMQVGKERVDRYE